MITQPVTFVIGAGASKELGLPLGTELRDNIANDLLEFWRPFRHLKDVSPAFEGIQRLGTYLAPLAKDVSPSELLKASDKLIDGLPAFGSIDDFLAVYCEEKIVAALTKAMIILHIREASQSALKDGDQVDLAWISVFWRIVSNGAKTPRDLIMSFLQTRIVNFNYDLTFEAGILKLIRQRFDLKQAEEIECARALSVVHPYGSVFGSTASSLYESDRIFEPIKPSESGTATDYIKTIHEEPITFGELSFEHFFKEARKIVFIGFGFHSSNLDWMDFSGRGIINTELKELLFSHYKISNYNAEQIKSKLKGQLFRSFGDGTRHLSEAAVEGRPETASEFLENISFGLN
jgi:hypothetical protein